MKSQLIQRKEYLDKLIAFREKQIIKVITGVRRCGKSTLMELYQRYLLQQGISPEQIISINLEDYDFDELREAPKLYAYIKERIMQGRMTYIFLDEIQRCEEYPKVVDSLFLKIMSTSILPAPTPICCPAKLPH